MSYHMVRKLNLLKHTVDIVKQMQSLVTKIFLLYGFHELKCVGGLLPNKTYLLTTLRTII
jgi:hypothetical protein